MVLQMSYSNGIMESLGVLSGFGVADAIWERYEQFAIPKLKESTVKLRGSLYYLKSLTPKAATKEMRSLEPLLPVLVKLSKAMEEEDDKAFQAFKSAATEFIEVVNLLYESLEDIAEPGGSYRASMPVLATDWNSQEDQHWDKY